MPLAIWQLLPTGVDPECVSRTPPAFWIDTPGWRNSCKSQRHCMNSVTSSSGHGVERFRASQAQIVAIARGVGARIVMY
jgi:hypothetical protein